MFKSAGLTRTNPALVAVRSEMDFYPPLISIMEQKPHPLARRTFYALLIFIAALFTWSLVGNIAIIAESRGKVVVVDGTRTIQTFENSTVEKIRVKEGQHVLAGDPLVEFDSTHANANFKQTQASLFSAKIELSVVGSLIQKLNKELKDKCSHLNTEYAEECLERVNLEWNEISTKMHELQAQILERKASINTSSKQIESLEKILPIAQQRERDYKSMVGKGFVSGYALQDKVKEHIQAENDLYTARLRLIELQSSLSGTRAAYDTWFATVANTLKQREIQAHQQIEQLSPEFSKHELSLSRMILLSPTSGYINKIFLKGAGEVATAAHPIMTIVPDTSNLSLDVSVKSADIGFVKERQQVTIKLDAFPYTRYGHIDGTVSMILPDVQEDEKSGLSFLVKIKPLSSHIIVDGKRVALKNGMTASADIETGQRRIIDFILDPIVQRATESLRQR
jgi:hemolysin D